LHDLYFKVVVLYLLSRNSEYTVIGVDANDVRIGIARFCGNEECCRPTADIQQTFAHLDLLTV